MRFRVLELVDTTRTEALFASELSTQDRPSRDEATRAIGQAIARYGGARGCAAALAYEYGAHPETSVSRMRWAIDVVREVYAPCECHADCSSRPGVVRMGTSMATTSSAYLCRCEHQPVITARLDPEPHRMPIPTNTHGPISLTSVGGAARLEELTEREQHVLTLMAEGLSNAGISQRLYLSAKTVETHVGAIFRKLDLHPEATENRRVAAVLICLRVPSRPADNEQNCGVFPDPGRARAS